MVPRNKQRFSIWTLSPSYQFAASVPLVSLHGHMVRLTVRTDFLKAFICVLKLVSTIYVRYICFSPQTQIIWTCGGPKEDATPAVSLGWGCTNFRHSGGHFVTWEVLWLSRAENCHCLLETVTTCGSEPPTIPLCRGIHTILTQSKIKLLNNTTCLYIAKRKDIMDNTSKLHPSCSKEASARLTCTSADSNRWQH